MMVALGFLVGTAASFGQVAEFGISGGRSLLRNNSLVSLPAESPEGTPIDVKFTDGFRLTFRLAINTRRFVGHEVGYAYNRTQLRFEEGPSVGTSDQGMAIHQGFYNFLLYAMPEGSSVRPFVTGGAHFSNFVPPGSSATRGGGATKFGVNYGGGIKARVSRKFMVRVDFRQFHTPKPEFFAGQTGGWLRQIEVSAGFGFVIGE
jgi:opacity protein-like surface antigen